jgi:chromosome segregation ATPase
MNIDAFEAEIARLESQLQDAIAALRALPDIQTAFQDLQGRYAHLQTLIDEAARLPERYAQDLATIRQQAEARLAHLEAPIRQQQAHLETMLAEHQRQSDTRLTLMKEQLQQQQAQWQAAFNQQQQGQTALEDALNSAIAELRQQLAALDQQTAAAHTNLQAFLQHALKDQALELEEESKRQFGVTMLLTMAIGAGLLIFLLVK